MEPSRNRNDRYIGPGRFQWPLLLVGIVVGLVFGVGIGYSAAPRPIPPHISNVTIDNRNLPTPTPRAESTAQIESTAEVNAPVVNDDPFIQATTLVAEPTRTALALTQAAPATIDTSFNADSDDPFMQATQIIVEATATAAALTQAAP